MQKVVLYCTSVYSRDQILSCYFPISFLAQRFFNHLNQV